MKRRDGGFTLVELLVVIVIIAILASLVVVLIKGVIDRARNASSSAFIQSLDSMCHAYKQDYSTFPPDSTYAGSQNLHLYLGRNRWVVTQVDNAGNPVASQQKKPFADFKRGQLQGSPAQTYPTPPVPLVDAWNTVIEYVKTNPQRNPDAIDIWSKGKNGVSDPSPPYGDDMGNWIRDF